MTTDTITITVPAEDAAELLLAVTMEGLPLRTGGGATLDAIDAALHAAGWRERPEYPGWIAPSV